MSYDSLVVSGDEEFLGLEIAGLTDDTDEYGIFISEILANSPAGECKLLRLGINIIIISFCFSPLHLK